MDMSYFDDPESLQWHRKSWEKFHKRGAVLYTLNAGAASQELRIGFRGKTVTTTLPSGAVETFVWKP